MVKIRLTRLGKRKMPFYRVIVIESNKRRDGRYIESLGFYDPINDQNSSKLDTEKAVYWLLNGAQPTDTVKDIFTKYGVLEKYDRERRKLSVEAKQKIPTNEKESPKE
jgi:small subunit ribosomal protein S16